MSSQFPDMGVEVREMSAAELKQRLDDGEQLTLLDTRRPGDFEAWHIDHPNLETVNVPFTEFLDGNDPAEDVPAGVPDPDGPLVTCCAKGISSLYVAEFLAQKGWDVVGLDDGMRGWARIYESREIPTDTAATVLQYYRPSSGCLGYLVVAGEEAAVIDPLRAFLDRYASDAEEHGAELRYAVDTHVHADHVSGVRTLGDHDDIDPVLPEGAVDRGLNFDATLVGDGDSIDLGGVSIGVEALPGHTTEMVGYRVGDVFVTGDTVFLSSVARPDLEDEDAAADAARTLHGTLQEMAEMDGDVRIAPGHASSERERGDDGTFTARIGDLRESLDAFDMSEDEFVDAVLANLPPRPNGYQTIIQANLGRQTVGDDQAFELELGPNNCAAE
jgi:glyoxylase-like metal-dependent hydrolase (beta-lactamase superfamily II)/rhodanese-related sulfurtransferase